MESWGGSVLENEAASRWCEEFAADGTLNVIREALNVAAGRPDDEDLDAEEAARALAAAEVVAAAAARIETPEALPAGVLSWASEHPEAGEPEVRALARRAIDRTIGGRCELADQWSSAGEERGWRVTVDGLLDRLT